jgi:hypothetical protein
MGYNYFSFQDEPAINKMVGLYQYGSAKQDAHTGTTSVFYDPFSFPDLLFPVYSLTPTPGPDGKTLAQAWAANFPSAPRNISGTGADDVLTGTSGADAITAAAGNDIVNGGAGIDTAVSNEPARNFALRQAAGSSSLTLQDKVGSDGTDTLTGIELIRFSDLTVDAASVTKTASLAFDQVLRVIDLYTAGLNRLPDALGLSYWGGKLADGASLSSVAKAFFGAPEAASLFSPATSTAAFVDALYGAAFGRAPDAAGGAYWRGELDAGRIQRSDLVTSLVAGARGPGGSAADAAYVAGEQAVGTYFAVTNGLTNAAWARTVGSIFNGSTASVATANAQTDVFAATAATTAGSELVVPIVGLAP